MTFKHRSEIDTIPSYKQGKAAPKSETGKSFKLSSNENPFHPLASVKCALEENTLGIINRYPDMSGAALCKRIAEFNNVKPENIVLGAGSTETITQLVNVLAGPGDEVIYPWRSFEAYPIIVTGAGATSVQVPLTAEGRHDIPAMIAAINDNTRLIIVNNPNNPTSTSVSEAEVRMLMAAVPSDVVVLLDEAYFHFNTDPDACVGLDLFEEYPNLVIARTFSKAYGLAGLRVGYGIARPEIVDAMRKVALPFGVTTMAQTAAIASLDAYDELHNRVAQLISERTRVIAALEAQGWQIPVPQANFYWLKLGERTDTAAAYFEKAGLAVRVFSGEGIRISVGEAEANNIVIDVCATLVNEGFLE